MWQCSLRRKVTPSCAISGHKLLIFLSTRCRDFARSFLPPAITTAPKRAFYVPLESYAASNPLREIFRAMLDPARLKRRGLLRSDAVARLAADVPSAGFLALKRQFAVVMLELWFERFAPQASWS